MASAPKPGTSQVGASDHQPQKTDSTASAYHSIAPYIIVTRAAQFIDFLKGPSAVRNASEFLAADKGPS